MSENSLLPFRTDILKQKPEPFLFENIHSNNNQTTLGISINDIIEDRIEENKNVNRNTILERLQNNGVLIQHCAELENLKNNQQQTPYSNSTEIIMEDSDSDSDSDYFSPEDKDQENEIKTVSKNESNTIKNMTIQPIINEEIVNDKRISLPQENNYDEAEVKNQLEYDKNTVFIICSSKQEEKAPGKEPSEEIPKSRISEFTALSKIYNWRQKLCNSFDSPFILDNVTWKSVDHYLTAAQHLTNTKMTIDDFKEREKQEMYHALYAKFTQNDDLARILEATKDAKLLYRVNKKKKIEFLELMWLRKLLLSYVQKTLKPLSEDNTLHTKKIIKKSKESPKNISLKNVDISLFSDNLPKIKPELIKASSYYMNNHTKFVQKISELFRKYSSDSTEKNDEFGLLSHQKVVRDYLNQITPYRGLLVYHNLGTGKSCTSIAVTEGMKNDKKIIILVPASLKTNYQFELQKCGDLLYRNNQYWEFVSTNGKPDLTPVLAKTLGLTINDVERNKGAWMVNINKIANFKNLSPDNQAMVREQITKMINNKYIFLHYNANNLETRINELKNTSKNLFDHTTIVVDEAHNLVSNIIGNIKKKNKNSIYLKLYNMIMDATNLKVVMLSGTPIINYPEELAVLFNILRGYVYTWTFKLEIKTSQKMTTETVRKILDRNKCLTYDYIEYKLNTLVITRNPYGFINVNEDTTTKYTQKKRGNLVNTTRTKQKGGYGLYGVKLDERGNISNEDFKKQVTRILNENDIIVQGIPKLVREKCLPDDEKEFKKIFLHENSNFQDKNANDIRHIQTLKRRILGLTSYFRSPNEDLLPKFISDTNGNNIHQINVVMSDYQFGEYAKVRKIELDNEKKSNKIKALQKKNVNNEDLFDIAGTYRTFSRTLCNFAFPTPPGRPFPKLKQDSQDEKSIDGLSEQTSDEYLTQLKTTMSYLRENRENILTIKKLEQYSPKMMKILQNLKNESHKGLHLLYSNYVTMEGIGVFQEVLNTNGYQEFKIKKDGSYWKLDFDFDGKMCYALYTGKEDAEVKEILRNVFNGDWENVPETISLELRKISRNNLFGEIIQLFMITSAGAEGINLKNTRYVHIMEPYWNNVRLEQVIGRARRINSHQLLPSELRTVQVFLYLSIMSDSHKNNENFKEIKVNDYSRIEENKTITTDEYLYEISQMKEKINNQFLKVVKETAMDCQLYIHKHKQTENLVCYGQKFPPDRTFVSYPLQKMDLLEDE